MATLAPPLFGDANGYDGEGYDTDGYDRSGYDKDGYDKDGCDKDGRDKDGTPRKNILSSDLDLPGIWQEFAGTQRRFLEHLREITITPDDIDDVTFCWQCGIPNWEEETSAVRGDNNTRVCEACSNDFVECVQCGDLYPESETQETLGEDTVCDGCRENSYQWCEDCNGWYPTDDEAEHTHSSDDNSARCCISPQRKFTLRNDGCEPLANDTRTEITLPAGTISTEGLDAISSYLRHESNNTRRSDCGRATKLYDLAYDLSPLGDLWQTKTGNYAKRLSSYAYKQYALKLTPEIMSQVGVIAREHSNPVSVTIAATRDLNLSAADFYHDDSCWWQSYSYSRCTLKTNGGFGLRSFTARGTVSGRAWVMPLRQDPRGRLAPTFDTITPDAFIVFNGYGELSGYTAPRLLAHMAGYTYRKVGFDCESMYINAGGYLVAPEDIAQKYASAGVRLNLNKHATLFEDEQAEKLAREAEKTVTTILAAQLAAAAEQEMADATVALHSRRDL